jgi:(2Fe-2S) ferredoxin
LSKKKTKLLVCVKGKKCPGQGSDDVFRALKETVADLDLKKRLKVKKSDCLGMCGLGPLVKVESACYGYVTDEDCKEIVQSHVFAKEPVERLLIRAKKRK